MIPARTKAIALAVLALGFVFGLAIPRYSFLALLASFALLSGTTFRLPRIWRLTVPILLVFTYLHVGISVFYGYWPPSALLVQPLMFLASYLLGLGLPTIGAFHDGRLMVRFVLLVALGMAIFAVLGSSLKPIQIEGADLLRKAPSFWDPSEFLNGPVFGLYASAGMVLLPLVLFVGKDLIDLRFWDGAIAATAGTLGLIANILFQNRSPMLALALSAAWTVMALLFRSGEGVADPRKRVLGRMTLIVLAVFLIGWIYSDQVYLAFFRFQSVGLGTNGRTDAWNKVLVHFFDQPFGGRRYNLAGLPYAHNLWLDVANDSGLLPMLVLVLLIALHIPYLIKSVRFTSSVDALVFSVLFISSVVGAALEPLLIASPTHFSWLLLLLGWSINIGSRFRRTLPREVTIHEDKGVSPNG